MSTGQPACDVPFCWPVLGLMEPWSSGTWSLESGWSLANTAPPLSTAKIRSGPLLSRPIPSDHLLIDGLVMIASPIQTCRSCCWPASWSAASPGRPVDQVACSFVGLQGRSPLQCSGTRTSPGEVHEYDARCMVHQQPQPCMKLSVTLVYIAHAISAGHPARLQSVLPLG